MFDLSVKEKPRSPFRRLRDKVTGRRRYDLDSSSAIVPSSSGALDEDLCPGPPKEKGRGSFFFRSQLHRSSLTGSTTSLGSASTLSSASSLGGLGSAEGVPSPSRHSSLSTDPAGRDFLPSPQLTHKRAFSDEVGQINLLPEAAQGLRPPKDPSSGSSLCINGSHIYCEEASPKPSFLSLGPPPPAQSGPGQQERGSSSVAGLPAVEPELPPWPASTFQKGPPKDLPRFIPSPPILAAQEEDKLSVKTIALNKQRVRARREEALQAENQPVPMAAPLAFPPEVRRVRPQDERDHRGNSRGHGQSPEPASSLEAAAGETEEAQSGRPCPQDPRGPVQKPSPHPVKPMRSTYAPESPRKDEPRQACSPIQTTGQERLRPESAIGGSSAASVVQLEKMEPKQSPPTKYHHLTREELLQLLLRREAELGKKEQQVQELEGYIDRLLVRIMEQSPTLLQIPLGEGAKATQ